LTADTRNIRITVADKKELTDNFPITPPHPEVPAALKKLRGAGFHLFALTDNLLQIQGLQLEHGGIIDLFDNRCSVEDLEVRRHKPAPEAYTYVERRLRVAPSDLFLIASPT
jgi:2-haloacid dehalogenase